MDALAPQRPARVVMDVDDAVQTATHVITVVDAQRRCRRTLKYMLGILTGAWIVSYECPYQAVLVAPSCDAARCAD